MYDLLRRKKILILSSRFLTGYGVGLVIRKQAEGFRKRGFDNLVIAASDVREADLPRDVKILAVGLEREDTERLILAQRPDLVIAHTPPFFSHVGLCRDYPAVKVVYDYGEPYPDLFPDEAARQEVNRKKCLALREFHLHISISEYIKKVSGIPGSRVNYLGTDHIAAGPEAVAGNVREMLGLKPDAFLITTLSRIGQGESRYKGFDLIRLIRQRLSEECGGAADVAFLVCGKSAPGAEGVKAELTADGCHVLLDLEEDFKRDILRQSDVYLSTSLWEGFDLPLTEAQYLGVPAAAFSTGAHPEVCPFHFPTVDELAGHLAVLRREPEYRRECGRVCAQFVRKRFTWEQSIDNLCVILEDALRTPLRTIEEEIAGRTSRRTDYSRCVQAHLDRMGRQAKAEFQPATGMNRIRYAVPRTAKVSVLIPNHNQPELFKECIGSVLRKTTYDNYEVVVVENHSNHPEIFKIYRKLSEDPRVRLLTWEKPFNYSALNNFAAREAKGEYLVFFNNDVEVINPDWMEALLEHAQRPEVGAVGAKLLYPDGSVQHAGVVLGLHGLAGHAHKNFAANAMGYMNRLQCVQNLSAVTAACLMIRKTVFQQMGGFDEGYPLAFNDVDLCLRLREKQYSILWTPYAKLYHHESKTRGIEDTPEKRERFTRELTLFNKKWKSALSAGDPFYNPNLTLEKEDFSVAVQPAGARVAG